MDLTICIFGDSIVWGGNDSQGGWANRLRNSLFNEFGTEIYPLGITGNTTVDLLKRFDVEAAARKPDVIIFAVGINDSVFTDTLKNSWVPIDNFEKNIGELISRARTYTKNIFFVGLTPIDDAKTNPIPWAAPHCCSMAAASRYDEVLHRVCTANNAEYILISGLLSLIDLPDGIHPNDIGHEKIYTSVREVLLKRFYATT